MPKKSSTRASTRWSRLTEIEEQEMTENARLYASTYDGTMVFKPSATGWEKVGEVPGTESESIAGSTKHPEQVYVADLQHGLFGTEDAGVHWAKLLDGEVW